MQGELKNKQKNKQKKRWFKWPGMSHGWAGLNIIETDDFPASIVYREPSEKEKKYQLGVNSLLMPDVRGKR